MANDTARSIKTLGGTRLRMRPTEKCTPQGYSLWEVYVTAETAPGGDRRKPVKLQQPRYVGSIALPGARKGCFVQPTGSGRWTVAASMTAAGTFFGQLAELGYL